MISNTFSWTARTGLELDSALRTSMARFWYGRSRLQFYAGVVLACLPALLSIANLALSILKANSAEYGFNEPRTYSYIDDDYPEYYPLEEHLVALAVEETGHYPIHGVDAKEEWASSSVAGFGYLRLGEEHRTFAIGMSHEAHCLRILRVLLEGNLTLEPADALWRSHDVERSGGTHTCLDWRLVYEAMAQNWEEWVRVRDDDFDTHSAVELSPPAGGIRGKETRVSIESKVITSFTASCVGGRLGRTF
ncbi:uncharacterized protein STEHIDRAFT_106554 [Stereum hirsutum FP-91666 SS1]|uniref:uncharacterized protein n=1 Tax=Stereum hirsutum (strain FP-91666) TaxID=721885 RepID=UPI000440A1A2|nr:uncharacterized protein STEHIDRAFT_106554 [Stereum hirsutum FP-91666 SS1]EIM91862.1 hypothetical protein STEHIDRAFT_106554 [Stereum hirsutum FP-91666 SS1]